MRTLLISIVSASAALLITGCTPAEQEEHPTGNESSITVKSVVASESGDKITWNVAVNSQYNNVILTVGALNYANAFTSSTNSYCNDSIHACSSVESVECDLLSRSGSYIDYSCKFVYSDGTFSNGDVDSISMPYTTTNDGQTENVTMGVTMDISHSYYYLDKNSYIYDVNDNKLILYLDAYN